MKPQRAAFMINFSSFEGPGPFLKTVVSCTRNIDFEGWRGGSMQTCCIFPTTFSCKGFCDDIFADFMDSGAPGNPRGNPRPTPKPTPKPTLTIVEPSTILDSDITLQTQVPASSIKEEGSTTTTPRKQPTVKRATKTKQLAVDPSVEPVITERRTSIKKKTPTSLA